jgi:hypothetical protein
MKDGWVVEELTLRAMPVRDVEVQAVAYHDSKSAVLQPDDPDSLVLANIQQTASSLALLPFSSPETSGTLAQHNPT